MKSRDQQMSQLNQTAGALANAMKPFVAALDEIASFNGVVVFVLDSHHVGSAGAAVVVNAANRPTRQLSFTRRHIMGRRVDLRATALGEMFRRPDAGYLSSRLNPRGHHVLGLAIGGSSSPLAIAQLAFDRATTAKLPSERMVRQRFGPFKGAIDEAMAGFERAASRHRSFADALLLNTPTTPNAYLIIWDVVGSSQLAATNYGRLRAYLNEFGSTVAQLVALAGGEVVGMRGDGQNIAIHLPTSVDPADPASVRVFVRKVARPLVDQIEQAHQAVGSDIGIRIRLVHGLAHVERSHLGEATGSEFFKLATRLKATQTKEPS